MLPLRSPAETSQELETPELIRHGGWMIMYGQSESPLLDGLYTTTSLGNGITLHQALSISIGVLLFTFRTMLPPILDYMAGRLDGWGGGRVVKDF